MLQVARLKTIIKQLGKSTAQKRIFISAFFGLFFFGLWAYWVNSGYGQYLAIKAAFIQGSYSFIVTLVNTYFIERVYRCLDGRRLQVITTAVLTTVLVCSLSWYLNTVLGTPEVLMTILPGCLVSSIYCFTYTFTLKQIARI